MTVEASVLKDAQAIGLRGWGLLAAGLVAGAAGGWTIGQYLNERNDRAAVQVRSNLEERLKSAELKAESLQRAADAVDSGDIDRVGAALVALSMYESDWVYVQDVCLRFLGSEVSDL